MLTINQPLPAPVRLVEFLTNRIDAAPALLLMRSGPAWRLPAVPCAAAGDVDRALAVVVGCD